MRSMTKLLALSVLLLPTPGVCLAMDAIAPISKEQAKKLGMDVRSKPAGPDHVRVELAFETKRLGEFFPGVVNFSDLPIYVDLEMRDGKKLLLSSTLGDRRPSPGHVAVSFTVARSELDKFSLTVMAWEGMGGIGCMLRVRDFVDLEKLR
jgi:hypothetical protein